MLLANSQRKVIPSLPLFWRCPGRRDTITTYRRYQDARDTAWRTLLRLDITTLPVDVDALAHRLGVTILSFPASADTPKLYALLKQAGPAPCVSLRIQGRWHIFLRPGSLDDAQKAFAIAHELGHLLLRHETYALSPGIRAFRGRENQGDLMDDPQHLDDYAADIFAIRLLAPACVLHALGADTPGKVTALSGMPPRAAAMRAERMELLTQRDAFFTHPLEKQVYDRFRPFIQAKKISGALAPAPADRPPSLPSQTAAPAQSIQQPPQEMSVLQMAFPKQATKDRPVQKQKKKGLSFRLFRLFVRVTQWFVGLTRLLRR